MDNTWIPLVSGFIGVVTGSLTSIIIIVIQSRYENKRALTKSAVDLALEDYRIANEHAKIHGVSVFPLSLYIHYHVRIMEYANKGNLTKETLAKVNIEQAQLRQAIIEANDELKSNK